MHAAEPKDQAPTGRRRRRWPPRWRPGWPLGWIVVVVLLQLVVSRTVFWHLGIRLDRSSLTWFWQYLDVHELRTNLWESLWYQHSQPPLFNLFLGLVSKLPDGWQANTFRAAYLGFGAAWATGIAVLLVRLGVRPWLTLGITTLAVWSPASVLYENWLFYTYPVSVLLLWSVVAFERLVRRPGAGAALAFAGCAAAAVLTRSALHPVWLLVSLAVAARCARDVPRALRGAALPLAIVALLLVKNLVLFDTFGFTSWFGMNLAKVATEPVPYEVRRELVDEGRVSPLALVRPFSPLERYPAGFRATTAKGPPVLAAPKKSTGSTNYNHAAYIGISRQYGRDARVLLQEYPEAWLGGVGRAWLLYLLPPTEYWELAGNRRQIEWLVWWYEAYVYGVPDAFSEADVLLVDRTDPHYLARRAGYLWAALLLLGLALGGRSLGRLLRGRERPSPRDAVAGLAALTLGYLLLVGNLLEVGENNRFRMLGEPLAWVLVGGALEQALGWARARRAARSGVGRAPAHGPAAGRRAVLPPDRSPSLPAGATLDG